MKRDFFDDRSLGKLSEAQVSDFCRYLVVVKLGCDDCGSLAKPLDSLIKQTLYRVKRLWPQHLRHYQLLSYLPHSL